jgi:hypothetical protein
VVRRTPEADAGLLADLVMASSGPRPGSDLGLEAQRQRSDRAIARTTPVLLGLLWLVTQAARRCHEAGLFSPERMARYAKEEPTYSDYLRLMRLTCSSVLTRNIPLMGGRVVVAVAAPFGSGAAPLR